jgi:hypothetical protein
MTAGRRSWLILLLLVVASVLVAGLAPRDQVLGASLRIVYLHGAWVWAALLLFAGAALAGILGFALKRDRLHYWSVGLARSATVFWLASLLLSLAAMQTSWNGLYLAEPRWQLGVRFGVTAVLLQIGVTVLRRPRLGSGLNIVFGLWLAAGLLATPAVMHPLSRLHQPRLPSAFLPGRARRLHSGWHLACPAAARA